MVEAAELALETLLERNQLLVLDECAVEVEEPEEIGEAAVQGEAEKNESGSRD